jgi:hypothetical protein
MVTRHLISDSLQELAIVEFSNGNIEFPKSPFSKVFRGMMNESFIYYVSNKKKEIKHYLRWILSVPGA